MRHEKCSEAEDVIDNTTGEDQIRRFKTIDVLLAEYDACNGTRDHYDGISWLIGSIFCGNLADAHRRDYA